MRLTTQQEVRAQLVPRHCPQGGVQPGVSGAVFPWASGADPREGGVAFNTCQETKVGRCPSEDRTVLKLGVHCLVAACSLLACGVLSHQFGLRVDTTVCV